MWFSGLRQRAVQPVDTNAPEEHVSSTVQIDPEDGSSMFPITSKTTQCNNSEDYNLNYHHLCEKLTQISQLILWQYIQSRDSAVGIATGYGVDD
jgi:hypothetical protein